MSEATRKDFWRKPRTGWSARILWFAAIAVPLFVLVLCVALTSGRPDTFPNVAGRSFLIAISISAVVGCGVLFIGWVRHWRNARRFLFFSACVITVIALSFTAEHWRSKLSWTHYRDAQIAKGEKMSTVS